MILLAVTAETWIVTGLGFGIVLGLLFCLVFILQGFGWIMQKIMAPKPAKPATPAPQPQQTSQPAEPAQEKKTHAAPLSAQPTDEGTKAAIAMALYLYNGANHDAPTAMIAPQARNTAWNIKTIGLNNVGF